MASTQGQTATLGGRVSIERLIARRARLLAVLRRAPENSAPVGEKRASLQAELEEIEGHLRGLAGMAAEALKPPADRETISIGPDDVAAIDAASLAGK